jgi:hypothetical protein
MGEFKSPAIKPSLAQHISGGPESQMTKGISDSALVMVNIQNRARDGTNRKNAGILGYDSKLKSVQALQLTAAHTSRQDIIDEIEANRYFVVLMAYDFRLMWKEKKAKLVWETRFSIQERGNEFDKQIAAMAQAASKYFGQQNDGLLRQTISEGQVKMDELKFLGVEPSK